MLVFWVVVVSDCVRKTDTADMADILLPALTWAEQDGTVTNSDRHISRQRSFLPAPGQARADWDIITEVAHRMGFAEHFPYRTSADVFREHAALSAFENEPESKGRRLFNIGDLQTISDEYYETLPVKAWPITANAPDGTARLFADGKFSTIDGKARFICVIPKAPQNDPSKEFPLILNTGRVRDHWHTMTRTGVSPRLSSHTYEPYAEVNQLDAMQFGVNDGSLAKLISPLNKSALVRVRCSTKQQRGSIFMPMHWNSQFSSMGRVGALIPSVTDPLSGQPELKHGIVSIEPCDFQWHGFIISTTPEKLKLEYADYWVRARGKGLWRYELAGQEQPEDWAARAHALLGSDEEDENWIEFFDSSQNHYRAAQFKGSKLINCVFIGPTEKLPQRDWLITLFQKDELNKSERTSLLSGLPPADQEDTGRIVCACFNVGEKTILKAINEKGLTTPEQIGECLQAGTNCGSCLPELRGFLSK